MLPTRPFSFQKQPVILQPLLTVSTHLTGPNTDWRMKSHTAVTTALLLHPAEIRQDALTEAGDLLPDVSVSSIQIITCFLVLKLILLDVKMGT